MLNLKEFMHDVHRNAVAHGWWDMTRPEYNVRALILSEWAEALEEARAMRPLIWHRCADAGNEPGVITICEKMEDCPCKADMHEVDCIAYMEKPEGIAIELMDGCIRILDWLGHEGLEELMTEGKMATIVGKGVSMLKSDYRAWNRDTQDIPVDMLVDILNDTVMRSVGGYGNHAYIYAFCMACAWVAAKGLDPEKLLLTKHAYNKGRPYKHGKAF